MRVAIFESIVTPGGHEHDFDKMLVSECRRAGYAVEMVVPEGYPFKLDYGVSVHYLRGPAVSYAGVSGLKKILLAAKRELRRIRWFDQLADYAAEQHFEAVIIPTATYRFLRSLRYSRLKDSRIPIIPIMHGINPREAANFFLQVRGLKRYPAINCAVITLGDSVFGEKPDNVRCILPPLYPPEEGVTDRKSVV